MGTSDAEPTLTAGQFAEELSTLHHMVALCAEESQLAVVVGNGWSEDDEGILRAEGLGD